MLKIQDGDGHQTDQLKNHHISVTIWLITIESMWWRTLILLSMLTILILKF